MNEKKKKAERPSADREFILDPQGGAGSPHDMGGKSRKKRMFECSSPQEREKFRHSRVGIVLDLRKTNKDL